MASFPKNISSILKLRGRSIPDISNPLQESLNIISFSLNISILFIIILFKTTFPNLSNKIEE